MAQNRKARNIKTRNHRLRIVTAPYIDNHLGNTFLTQSSIFDNATSFSPFAKLKPIFA